MVSSVVKAKGRTSRFIGEKGEFLDSMAGEFINSSDRGSFYSVAATRYVEKFGYIVYGEPPDLRTMNDAGKAAELERRRKFLPWLRTTLGGWFRHKYGRGRTDQSTLNKILLTMKDISHQRPNKPKVLHRYSQLHYKDRVKPNFDSFWTSQEGAIPKSQRLAMTQDFVQKTWASESLEFRAAFEQRVETEYQESLKAYNRRMDYSQTTPQAKHDAWLTIDSVVPNIADALGEWVGGAVHIDIVVPLGSDEGQIHVKSVQSRVVVPDDEIEDQEGSTQLLFAEWDPEADQDHKARLVKYAKAIFSEEECQRRIIADDDASTGVSVSTDLEDVPSPPTLTKKRSRANAPKKRRNSVTLETIRQGPEVTVPPKPVPSDSSSVQDHLQDHRTYNADDVKADDDGLFHFQDDETVIAVAKMAVAAAGGSYARRSLVADLNSTGSSTLPSLSGSGKRTATAQMLLDMRENSDSGKPHELAPLDTISRTRNTIPDSSMPPTLLASRRTSPRKSPTTPPQRDFGLGVDATEREEPDSSHATTPPPRYKKTSRTRKVIQEDEEETDEQPPPPLPAKPTVDAVEQEEPDSSHAMTPSPRHKKTSRKRKVIQDEEEEEISEPNSPPLPTKSVQTSTPPLVVGDEADQIVSTQDAAIPDTSATNAPARSSRKRRVIEEEGKNSLASTPTDPMVPSQAVATSGIPPTKAPARSSQKRRLGKEVEKTEVAPAPAKRVRTENQPTVEEAGAGTTRVRNKSAKLQAAEDAKAEKAASKGKPRKAARRKA